MSQMLLQWNLKFNSFLIRIKILSNFQSMSIQIQWQLCAELSVYKLFYFHFKWTSIFVFTTGKIFSLNKTVLETIRQTPHLLYLQEALAMLGIPHTEILEILSAILLLGNIVFVQGKTIPVFYLISL